MQNDLKDRIARLKAMLIRVANINPQDAAGYTLNDAYHYVHENSKVLVAERYFIETLSVITELEAELRRVKALLDSPDMVKAVAKAIQNEACCDDLHGIDYAKAAIAAIKEMVTNETH